MKDYKVCIKTTFIKWYKVQADSKEDAIDIANNLIATDNPCDTPFFDTEIAEVL